MLISGRPVWGMIVGALFALTWFGSALGQADLVSFSDDSLRTRYETLVQELRCPKCQNQNLADSNSAISVDLRRQIQRLLEEGKTDAEIKNYLVDRYSTFILYEPVFRGPTMFLWLAPIILVLGALGTAIIMRRKYSSMNGYNESHNHVLTREERSRLSKITLEEDI